MRHRVSLEYVMLNVQSFFYVFEGGWRKGVKHVFSPVIFRVPFLDYQRLALPVLEGGVESPEFIE